MQNCLMKPREYSIPYYSSSLVYFCMLYLLYNLPISKIQLDGVESFINNYLVLVQFSVVEINHTDNSFNRDIPAFLFFNVC